MCKTRNEKSRIGLLYRSVGTGTGTRKKPRRTTTNRYRQTGMVSYRFDCTGYNNKSSNPRLVKKDPILHKVTMGPKKATKADKGKGKVTGDEPLARRTRSSSVVIREPTDETPREEPRRSESRKSNARKKKHDEPAVVEGEEYECVLESQSEEE
ncbi:unnamed protein product [Cochlearia groenlandica]